MSDRSATRKFMILAALAALLAFAAALVRYVKLGTVEATWIGGGVFLTCVAMGAWMKLRGGPDA